VPETASALAAWQPFYVVVGSAAAALTGLQFVVMAIVADHHRGTRRDVDAFATPTILHFSAVLLISAIVSAPWPTLAGAAVALGASGSAGVVYVLIVLRRARRALYRPVTEDWIWHVILPMAAYVALFAASDVLWFSAPRAAMFVVAAAALVLLFDGIHNAWDTVTYIVVDDGH